MILGFYPEEKKPESRWVDYKDFNPDHQRSSGAMFIEDRGVDIVWVLQVKGLGALMLRADSDRETGRLNFKGVSEFTDREIGHRK